MNFAKGTNENKTDKEILINALILAGWVFFTNLAGFSIVIGITAMLQIIIGALIAAALAFFSYLIAARAIKKPETPIP